MVNVEASALPSVVVVENGTWAFRGDPMPAELPTTTVDLVEETDFAKFLLNGGPAVDVPTAEEAAGYPDASAARSA